MNQLISVGDLIDQSWSIYRSHFRSFIKLSGWLAILAILQIIALVLYPTVSALSYQEILTRSETVGVILFMITNFILSPLLGFWVFLSVTQAAHTATSRGNIIPSLILHETKTKFIPAIVVTLLVGLMLILAQIISLGPALLIGIVGTWINNTPLLIMANLAFILGLFASLFLTSRWTIFYIMAPYANILDGAQKKSALEKSHTIVKGKFWSVLLRVVLPKFVFILFGLFIATILTLLIQFLIQGSTGLDIDLALRLNTLATSVMPILIAILLNPLLILSDVLLYTNLKNNI